MCGPTYVAVPDKFSLFGQDWRVLRVGDMEDRDKALGLMDVHEKRISLQSGLPDDIVGQVYLHELTHAVLSLMSEDELNDDEKFVDTFASLFHQALTTGETNAVDSGSCAHSRSRS